MTQKRRPRRQVIASLPQTSQPMETNPELRAAILEAVDTQLREGTPPETRATLDRLVALGHTPEGARQLIAHVVVHEIFNVMARGERYDQTRFIAALHRLPALPEENDKVTG